MWRGRGHHRQTDMNGSQYRDMWGAGDQAVVELGCNRGVSGLFWLVIALQFKA